MAKNENPEMPEIHRKLSKLKTPIDNVCNYYKPGEKPCLCYLSTILALITSKATLKQ